MRYALTLLALSLGLAAPSRAATVFIQDSASPNCGNVTTAGYKGFFEAASFSIGGANPISLSTSSGSGAGKISLSNLVVTKAVDSCSGNLITQFLQGHVIPTLRLIEVEAVGENVPRQILTITLSEVEIASYNLSDSSGGGAGTESISFKFTKATITATPTTPQGTPGTPVTVTYDLTTNVVQ